MAVTVIDVVGRYLFNAPLPGSFEITKVMMAALIFAALPAVSRFEQHITIDLLDGITPQRLVRFRQITINTVCAIALAILCWRLWIYAVQTAEFGDVTEYLRLPRAPAVFYMSVFSGLGAAVLFRQRSALHVRRHQAGQANHSTDRQRVSGLMTVRLLSTRDGRAIES